MLLQWFSIYSKGLHFLKHFLFVKQNWRYKIANFIAVSNSDFDMKTFVNIFVISTNEVQFSSSLDTSRSSYINFEKNIDNTRFLRAW